MGRLPFLLLICMPMFFFSCGEDNNGPKPNAVPTKLMVTSVSPSSPQDNTDFTVTIKSVDDNNNPSNVTVTTSVNVQATGVTTGALLGFNNATIPVGSNETSITVSFTAATTSLVLRAITFGGMSLASANSAPITIRGCTAPVFATNIIGRWQGQRTFGVGFQGYTTINANGTGSSDMTTNPKGVLSAVVWDSLNFRDVETGNFRWSVSGNTLTATFFTSLPRTGTKVNTYTLSRNTCNIVAFSRTGSFSESFELYRR